MNILLVDSSRGEEKFLPEINSYFKEKFMGSEHKFTYIELKNQKIFGCTVCKQCEKQEPYLCVIKDIGAEIIKRMPTTDILILLSPIWFGGYEYKLKSVIDRFSPLVSPFFTVINGELHFQKRYDKYAQWFVVGETLSSNYNTGDIFKRLVKRNAINCYSEIYEAKVLENENDISSTKKDFENFYQRVGEKDETK